MRQTGERNRSKRRITLKMPVRVGDASILTGIFYIPQVRVSNSVYRNLNKYKLLIIDEIGYFPVDRNIAGLFFQLVAARYEKRSVIVTTNQPLSKWGEVFGDSVIANAIIDRLVHHSKIIKITGRSYRIKGMIEEGDTGSADQKSRANT